MSKRQVRVGIDVGGTNTKAVAVDNETYDIIGVAKGVVSGFLSKIQGNINDIPVDASGKKKIVSSYRYIAQNDFTKEQVSRAIDELINEGCSVIAASKTFGVDDDKEERLIQEVGEEKGIVVCAASDISKLYGLTRRTRTAVVNGSILPKMIGTADSTEQAVREAGIGAPLMIMRGDGGVMDIQEMRKRPVLTMLSGPAASTVGALMYLRVSNGVFFEVGGTTTDIGVIKNGRPMVDYATVGGQRTMVSSMDVNTVGVAGGSMIRAGGSKVTHVGPRSCHIANLDYVAFTDPAKLGQVTIEFISPKEGDPSDYVAVRGGDGQLYALTTTCAANALGIIEEGDYSYGYPESCKKAFDALGKALNMTGEEAATATLDKAADITIEVIENLLDKYHVEQSQTTIVGGGGGAKVLLPFTAKKMGVEYQLADQAEIISSIGVALAMVRDVVERVIPSPTPQDIAEIRQEATDAVIKSGATADSVEVQIEIDQQTSKVRAIATGSTEIATQDISKRVDIEEAGEIAAKSMGVTADNVELLAQTEEFAVFGRPVGSKMEIRGVDRKGFVKLQREDGDALATTTGGARSAAGQMWDELSVFKSDIKLNPDIYLCIGGRIIDFEGMSDINQLNMLMDSELTLRQGNEQMIVIGAKNDL